MQLFVTPDLEAGLEGLKKVCERQPSGSPKVEL